MQGSTPPSLKLVHVRQLTSVFEEIVNFLSLQISRSIGDFTTDCV